MDATLVAEAHALRAAMVRLHRLGLVVEANTLSREHRRLACTFVRLGEHFAEEPTPAPAPRRIGFAYPGAR